MYIINPINQLKYDIYNKKAKIILKNYIKYYQNGGKIPLPCFNNLEILLNELLQRFYSKDLKKQILYNKKCGKKPNNLPTWCTLIKLLKNDSENFYLIKFIVNERKKYNDKLIVYLEKNMEPYKIKVNNFGSLKDTSDYDYQVSFDILDIDNKFINKLIKLISLLRKDWNKMNTKIGVGLRNIPTDNFIETNWYLPTIIYNVKNNNKNKLKSYGYIHKNIIFIKPYFIKNKNSIIDFLLNDIKLIFKKKKENLNKCYKNYNLVQKKYILLLKNILIDNRNIHEKKIKINNILLNLVSCNHICADMYFSICNIIYTVGYIQSNINIDNIELYAIPAFIENYIFYKKTHKEKYKNRYENAQQNLNKNIAIRYLKIILNILKKNKNISIINEILKHLNK